MWTAAAGLWLLVQVGVSASTPDAARCGAGETCQAPDAAAGEAQTKGAVMLQVGSKGATRKAHNATWAPPELLAEHVHRYRTFVQALLQEPAGCEDKSASFKISAKAVDAQHLKLLALVDQVRRMLLERVEKEGLHDGLELSGDGLKPLRTLLVWLKQYTVVHFDAEERMMKEASYLDFVAHKAAHRAFYGHVMMWGEIVDVMMRNQGGFHVGNVFVMVDKWFQDHICVQDKRVEAFLESSGKRDAINDEHNPEGVADTMPDCVPALVGRDPCVSPVLLQGLRPAKAPAPEWWAPPEHLAAHDYWYRAFVNELLQNPIVCELADSFDIAVKAVDSQHHKLLTLVDEVRLLLLKRVRRLGFNDGLLLTGPELQPLGTVLLWLKQYGVVHFDAEEQTMEALGYPDLAHHKALHRAFFGQMNMASEVVANMMSFGGGFHVGPIYVFMAKWVQDHICKLDKTVGKFIGESGAELNETEDIIPDIVPEIAESGEEHQPY